MKPSPIWFDDQDTAIHEIARSQGLVDLLRSATTGPPSESAEALFEQVRRSLDTALLLLKPESSPEGRGSVKRTDSHQMEDGNGTNDVSREKRKNGGSWTNITNQPYEDGYQWRKYGEKVLQGKKLRRSYYRCTYKTERGCPAIKQVQRPVNDCQSMFFVTYTNKHTCQDRVMISTTTSRSTLDHGGSFVLSSESHRHHHHHQSIGNREQEKEVKQEMSPDLSSVENTVPPEEHIKESDGSSANDALFDGLDLLSSTYYPMTPWCSSNLDYLMDLDGSGDGSLFYY